MDKTCISDLMTRDLITTSGQRPFNDVVMQMRDRACSCLLIAERGIPIGIITERDIVLACSQQLEGQDMSGATAADIMSSPPITINENATLFEALVISRSHRIRHLPIVSDSGELTGLVTYTDLVNTHFRLVDASTEAMAQHILQRNSELSAANERLLSLSMTDPLMDIGNRRAMEIDLQHELAAAQRYHHPLSILLLDVDYFKSYNDHYGHAAGDAALRQIADHLKEGLRDADRIYRYGGEECLVILPETPLTEAVTVAERLQQSLADKQLPHTQSPLQHLTFSAGLSAFEPPAEKLTLESLINQADSRLYAAKDAGRNQVRATTSAMA